MPVFLVRHAKAGDRGAWAPPDELRPLSRKGWAQAEGLARQLEGEPVDVVLSSPYVRCVQTVEPLAAARGLTVEPHVALAEEADPAEVEGLLDEVVKQDVVLCTHGNLVPLLLHRLVAAGVDFQDPPDRWKKGSAWILEGDGGRYRSARYLPPISE